MQGRKKILKTFINLFPACENTELLVVFGGPATKNYRKFIVIYAKVAWAYLLLSIFLDGGENGKRRDAIKVGRFIFDSAKKD